MVLWFLIIDKSLRRRKPRSAQMVHVVQRRRGCLVRWELVSPGEMSDEFTSHKHLGLPGGQVGWLANWLWLEGLKPRSCERRTTTARRCIKSNRLWACHYHDLPANWNHRWLQFFASSTSGGLSVSAPAGGWWLPHLIRPGSLCS
jgi:hypothetical protein